MNPYKWADEEGVEVLIEPCEDEPGCAHLETEGACIPGSYIADLALHLYEAAGLPAPVMLELPEIDPDAWLQSGPVRMGLTGDGEVAVAVGNAQSSAAPSDIRHIAALLCAYADAAEAEPDPAEVGELAATLRAELYPDHMRRSLPPQSFEDLARAALRWMRDRKAAP